MKWGVSHIVQKWLCSVPWCWRVYRKRSAATGTELAQPPSKKRAQQVTVVGPGFAIRFPRQSTFQHGAVKVLHGARASAFSQGRIKTAPLRIWPRTYTMGWASVWNKTSSTARPIPVTLNLPLGVPKKVPILGINYRRKTNSPLIGISFLSRWRRYAPWMTPSASLI